MDVVKKNILSILCGVVAIAAIVAVWYPMSGKFQQLQAEVDARAAKEQQISSIKSKQRVLPTLGPSDVAVALKKFPNKLDIDTVKAVITTSLVNQAQELAQDAIKCNEPSHTRLVSSSLPNPTDPSRYDFQDTDLAALANLRKNVLNGDMPPNDAQIKVRLDALRAEKDKLLQRFNGAVTNQDAVDAEYNAAAALVPDEMRMETAQSHKMYIFPDALAVDPIIGDKSKPPTADQIWYAQVGYWVQQDVASAIARTNAKASNVLDAPIKALVHLDVPVSSLLYLLPMPEGAASSGGRRGGGMDAFVSTAGDPDAKLTTQTALTPTGRVCNPLYDVVQFTLGVNVDARDVEMFLRNLCADQFITVKQMNLSRLDLEDETGGAPSNLNGGYHRGGAGDDAPATKGFIYGSDVPVAHLEIQCEELFLRSWTVPWMPELVKRDLGIVAPTADNTGQAPVRRGAMR